MKNCNSTSNSKKKVNLNIVSFEDIKKKIDNINEDFKEIQNQSISKERKQNVFEIYSTNSFNKIGNFPFLNTDKINFRNEFSKKIMEIYKVKIKEEFVFIFQKIKIIL